jgi:plastocyanin
VLLAVAGLLCLSGPAGAAGHDIAIHQYAYAPATLTIQQGDTVTWTNQDSVAHDVTVTSGPTAFHSPMLAQGQSWTYTFATAGSYGYVCSVHPDMTASITVAPRPTRSPAPHSPVRHTQAVAPASSAPPSHAAGARPGPRAHRPPAPTAQAEVAAPAMSQQIGTDAPAATLDPLLFVAGASLAVMVFCLLLMTSRPVAQPAGEAAED